MQAIDFSKKSPRRDLPMVDVEIESVTMQAVANGWVVPPGISTVRVYKDQLSQIQALTRDDEENSRIELARKEFDLRLKKFIKDKCDGDAAKGQGTFGQSLESIYISMNAGHEFPHIRPFTKIRIVKDDIPPPQETEKWNTQKQTVAMIAEAVKGLLGEEGGLLGKLVSAEVEKRMSNRSSQSGGGNQHRK